MKKTLNRELRKRGNSEPRDVKETFRGNEVPVLGWGFGRTVGIGRFMSVSVGFFECPAWERKELASHSEASLKFAFGRLWSAKNEGRRAIFNWEYAANLLGSTICAR